MWRKILKEMGKTSSITSPKSYWKLAKTVPFYRATKISRWDKSPGQMTCQSLWPLGLPVDRPVDRTQVLNYQSISRSTEARTREHCSLAGRPLDRPGPDPESKLSESVDWPSRQGLCTFLCTSVDRSVDRLLARSTGRSTARRLGQR